MNDKWVEVFDIKDPSTNTNGNKEEGKPIHIIGRRMYCDI